MRLPSAALPVLGSIALAFALAPNGRSQGSTAAIVFTSPSAPQHDRVIVTIDDDQPGNDASSAADVGAGSFTIDFWLKGTLANNVTSNLGGDREVFAAIAKQGNVIVDREIAGPCGAEFVLSVAGGFIRFHTGRGASAPFDSDHTLEGDRNVLDGNWHHVACVRDVESGSKSIFVDGELDVQSSVGVSYADLSWPNDGTGNSVAATLVLGADRLDSAAPAAPEFHGGFDELRLWSRPLTRSQILSRFDRVMPSLPPELVLWLRFEEGSGTSANDSAAVGNPPAVVVNGVPGDGEWALAMTGPGAVAPISPGLLPAGFQRQIVTESLTEPTALEFLPDGRLLIAERGGTIRVLAAGALLTTPLIQLNCDTSNGERGLLGLAADPQFASNGYIYAFYTTTEPRDRVGRFQVVGNQASPSSEQVIWDAPTTASEFHHGGAIEFTTDGKLLIAVGDQLDSENAQDLGVPFGKLLRVGADGSVPSDNPFVATPGADPRIYALGFRNPFRFTVDVDGAIYLGDVGGNTTAAQEELNRILPGANFGWPHQEGTNCYLSDCSFLSLPMWSYRHDDPEYYLLQPQGSITAGPVYRATKFPPSYHGNVFVADYANRSIRRLIRDPSGDVLADPVFLWTGLARTPVDLEVGPDGALYYLSFGVPYGGLPDQAALFRIDWIGTTNQVPVPFAAATPTAGMAPLAVQFSSAGSIDPDFGPSALQYQWSFGDGAFSTSANPNHVYAQNGRYTALLTVSDGAASASSQAILVEVGGKPRVSIATPLADSSYVAGQSIPFQGSASDPEDGSLPAGSLVWQVFLIHDDHVHPFLGPLTGASGVLAIPNTGHAPSDTHFEIRLTATDSDGLSGSATIAIHPNTSTLAFDTQPSGIPLALDGEPLATPAIEFSLDGFVHELEAPTVFVLGGQAHAFRCWTDGGAATHSIVAPIGGANRTAIYDSVNPTEVSVVVSALDRHAQFQTSTGTKLINPSLANALRLGKDVNGGIETAFQFSSPIPPHAVVVSAALELTGSGGGFGQPACVIHAYDIGDAPPFVPDWPIPLTEFVSLGTASVTWAIPALLAGQSTTSPDLSALLQSVIDRPDYQPGNHVAFVLDGKTNVLPHYHDVLAFGTANPPRLRVKYVVPSSGGGPCSSGCGFTTWTAPTQKAADRLGLVGTGNPHPGGLATLIASGIDSASTAILLVAPNSGSLPFMGGTLLVGLGGFLYTLPLPVSDGIASLPIPILDSPAVVGVRLVFQVVASDASQLVGVALSNGLELVICP